ALLRDAKLAWSTYMHQSIAGAENTISDLALVRVLAAVAFVALGTGGLVAAEAAGALGGTALGGVAGAGVGTLAAAAVGADVAANSDTPIGDVVRGTVDEIGRTGVISNLGYAA